MTQKKLKKPLKIVSSQVKEEYKHKDWLLECLRVLRPPEKLTVSEWADKYRVLDNKTSAEPGQWSTSRTPYLRGIMDAFSDPEIEEIIFVKPTQVGGTECLNNILGYIICQDQSPSLVVYPTLDLAEYTSKNRIQPMIKSSSAIFEHYNDSDSKMLELQFDGMYVVLSGANSPASLASRPIRNLLLDEIDKYPSNAGKEADPISLARERTKTFAHNKKIIMTSTPTLKSGQIWKAWENADSQLKYFVPCPHCGAYQIFQFKQIKWRESAKTPDEVQQAAYYECVSCNAMITDAHKQQMLLGGEWRPIKNSGKRKTAFGLNTLYSPWVRFGDVAYEFKKSKNDPDLLMNFINSWLGEPWEQTEVKMSSDSVLARQSDYEELIVPDETIILTAGVDVQKDSFYYTIRAWGENMTSWNIAHGQVTSWEDIEYIMNTPYFSRNEKAFQVNLAAVDSGNNTEEVYDFCAYNQEWAIPVKGSSNPLLARYKISTIDKLNSKANGMRLYIVDGNQYKDMIAGRLKRPCGQGCWMVYKGCDRDYAEQITSEEKTLVKKGGQDLFLWKPKSTHIANHYLDCEVYAGLAADLLNIRVARLTPDEERPQPKPKKANDSNNNSNWINVKGSWLK